LSIEDFDIDPWMAIDMPSPDGLDLDALQRVQVIVYACLYTLGGSLRNGVNFPECRFLRCFMQAWHDAYAMRQREGEIAVKPYRPPVSEPR
jgi:hypothetical protein